MFYIPVHIFNRNKPFEPTNIDREGIGEGSIHGMFVGTVFVRVETRQGEKSSNKLPEYRFCGQIGNHTSEKQSDRTKHK